MSEVDNKLADSVADDGSINPGELLAQARAKAGFSTADVARQLKLSVGQVEALEAGRFERLPGSVFVRGFIRNYARLVKLDPDHLLIAAGSRLPRQEGRPEMPPSQNIPFPSARPPRWRKYAWAAAVIVAVLALYELIVSNKDAVVTTHPVDVEPAPVAAPNPQNDLARVADSARSKAQSAAPPVKIADKQKRTAPESVPSAAPVGVVSSMAPPPESMAKPAAPSPAGSVLRSPGPPQQTAPGPAPVSPTATVTPEATDPNAKEVTLAFEDESWVEIRDRNGKVLLWQLNPAGTRQVVKGSPPLSFVIGNAHGVRVTFDERPVDLAPYTNTDVARMTLQ